MFVHSLCVLACFYFYYTHRKQVFTYEGLSVRAKYIPTRALPSRREISWRFSKVAKTFNLATKQESVSPGGSAVVRENDFSSAWSSSFSMV